MTTAMANPMPIRPIPMAIPCPTGLDLDSDNDGIHDLFESLSDRERFKTLDRQNNGRVDDSYAVGRNGVADVLETSADSGTIAEALSNVDDDDHAGLFVTLTATTTPSMTSSKPAASIAMAMANWMISSTVTATGSTIDAKRASCRCTTAMTTPGLDFRDTDSDGDTIPDRVESDGKRSNPTDTDGDGEEDYRDLDSDNDGFTDKQEAGPTPSRPIDSDGDGTADYRDPSVSPTSAGAADPGTSQPDSEGGDDTGSGTGTDSGSILNDEDPGTEPTNPQPGTDTGGDTGAGAEGDADGDTLSDALEGSRDSDDDGVPDRLDLDSDNDGLLDSVEAVSITNPVPGVDTDGDGVPDYRDIDSDNDSIWDVNERGYGVPLQSGRLPGEVDADGLAPEADGLLDDSDGDGVVDFRDLESDNDGIPDVLEARGVDVNGDGRLDAISDLDGDGAEDNLLLTTGAWVDTDADIRPDHLDLDSDNDGISDLTEVHGGAPDIDNDGVLDSFVDENRDGYDDNLRESVVVLLDTDRDSDPDQVDLDSDGDGVYDLVEAGGTDMDDDGIVDAMADRDGDGIPDSVDVDQTGGTDSNGNGIDDSVDAELVDAPDTDGDGIIDEADPDSNGDGFVGSPETGQGLSAQLPDDDADGVPNFQQDDGQIKAGVDGHGFGCVALSSNPDTRDPLFLLLLMASMGVALLRRRTKKEP